TCFAVCWLVSSKVELQVCRLVRNWARRMLRCLRCDPSQKHKGSLSAPFDSALEFRGRRHRAMHGSRGSVTVGLRASLVNDVEGRFRGSPEAVESGRGYNLPNARLAGLRTQAQSNFLGA